MVALTIVAAMLPVAGVASPAAAAAATGSGVSYTLEGCRASANAYLPGTFVCPTPSYTTGNLGGGWNELDLVPGRVTVAAGNSAPASQDFSFAVAVDNCSDTSGATNCSTGTPGYDRLSTPVLNGSLSSGTCGSVSVGDAKYAPPAGAAIGGTGTSLYRIITITGQAMNSSCKYDFYARLALGSSGYPGSSLHFDLANTDLGTAGIGAKDVSIPVKGILPPGLSKTQSSSEGSSVVWNVMKTATPTTVNFPNTCSTSANEPTSAPVTITVAWTKSSAVAGAITVTAVVSVTNNAHREIDASVSDQLYDGANPATGVADGAPDVTALLLSANESTSFTDTFSVPSGTASAFSDIATATFTDPVFDETIGSTHVQASSNVVVLAPTSGATATISDVEALTGSSDYTFSVDSVTGTQGSFSDYPLLGAKTTGPVTWSSGTVSGSGSTTFHKTVYVGSPTVGSATLSDTATLTPDNQTATSASASTTITSGASVAIVISKTINAKFLTDKTFIFTATGADGSTGSTTITIPAGSVGPVTGTISPLDPGVSYTITEPAVAPFPPQTIPGVEVDLPACSLTQPVVNTTPPARAQVQKLTVPGGSTTWEFTLSGVEPNSTPVTDLAGGTSEVLHAVIANTPAVLFASGLDQDGATYTVTETAQTHWDLTSVSGSVTGTASTRAATSSTVTRTCSFTLNLTTDSLLSCTFTNTQRSDVKVIKTENGGTPTHAYSFELKGNGTTPAFDQTLTTDGTNLGTLDFGYLVPGSYTLCELAVPAGTNSTLQTAYGGTLNATTGDICLTFTLAAGSDRTFTIDNSHPNGTQRTIGYWKHWNTYTLGSGAAAMSAKTGNALMDSFLPQPLGSYYTVSTAQQGVAVLSYPASKYAENQLAAQLLAAELNVGAGASSCATVTNAISTANSLLTQIHYVGPKGATVGANHPLRSQFVNTATTLDNYNNALVC